MLSVQEAVDEMTDRDRWVDLLKHVSTLNVAAMVLFLALLTDFGEVRGFSFLIPVLSLFCFGASLLTAMGGGLAWVALWPSVFEKSARFVVVMAYVLFSAGMIWAVIVAANAVAANPGQ
jgi:hypothetical protein